MLHRQQQEQQQQQQQEGCEENNNNNDESSSSSKSSSADNKKPKSVASSVTTDRRFEQLVECVISGVNVKKRKAESLQRQLDKSTDELSIDIAEVLDEEDVQVDEGLDIRDSCRAAWGISVLGAHHLETMGGEKVKDVLLALSLRIRELLLARLQLLRQDDILSDDNGMTSSSSTNNSRGTSELSF